MLEYKGVFYKGEKSKKFYEFGAHFKYSELVAALEELQKKIEENLDNLKSKKEKDDSVSKSNSNKEKKINSNFLTLNNNKNHFNKNIVNINRDKSLDKEKARKKKLIDLINYNMKVSPFKSNLLFNSRRNYCNNSLNKNIKGKVSKSKGSKINTNRTNTYLKTQINQDKNTNNKYNLPLIQSSYFNNLANKSFFRKNQNDNIKINLKFISKLSLNKTKNFNDNIFLKNKIFTPDKDIHTDTPFSNELFETNKNSKNFDTIDKIYTKNNRYNFENLSKNLNNKNNIKTLNNN